METDTTEATPRIQRIADAVGVPESHADFLRQVDEQVKNDGGFVDREAGVVYATARIQGVPVNPREVADAAGDGVTDTDVVRDMRHAVDGLPFDVTVEDPVEFVDRYVDELDDIMRLPDGFRDDARSVCDDATTAGFHSGKAPSGFAAAVVYATSVMRNADIGQPAVADVADVARMTIRTQYRDIIDAATGVESMKETTDDVPDLVDRIADAIDRVPDDVKTDAADMATAVVDERPDFADKTKPAGVAAGVFYVVAEGHRFDVSMTEVATVAGVSKHTVVARVKDVREWANGGDD